MGLLIICAIILIGLGFIVRHNMKVRKELIAKGALQNLSTVHIEGIPFVNSGQHLLLSLFPDRIGVGDQYNIPLQSIKNIKISTEKEVTEKERSVIGRAAVGGLLLGPVGAIVGGLSGAKNKKNTTQNEFLVVDFIDDQSQTNKAVFSVTNNLFANSFVKKTIVQINGNAK